MFTITFPFTFSFGRFKKKTLLCPNNENYFEPFKRFLRIASLNFPANTIRIRPITDNLKVKTTGFHPAKRDPIFADIFFGGARSKFE